LSLKGDREGVLVVTYLSLKGDKEGVPVISYSSLKGDKLEHLTAKTLSCKVVFSCIDVKVYKVNRRHRVSDKVTKQKQGLAKMGISCDRGEIFNVWAARRVSHLFYQ
jgi:hypothetical protein